MTGDPPEEDFERLRRQAARDEEERARRDGFHEVENWARKQPLEPGQPPPDPVHVIRVRLPERPGVELYALCRWSLAARLARDAAAAGERGRVTDLGPDALIAAAAADPAAFAHGTIMVNVGVAKDGRWLTWELASPREPVPGTRRWGARQN
jgi:hypothetical protein